MCRCVTFSLTSLETETALSQETLRLAVLLMVTELSVVVESSSMVMRGCEWMPEEVRVS